MKNTIILDFNSCASTVEGENVMQIFTHPLPFFCPNISNASLEVKHQLEYLEEAHNKEDLDSEENISADGTPICTFIVNQDNCLVFLVDKKIVENSCMAREYIAGFIVSYETPKLIYDPSPVGTAAGYNMLVKRHRDHMIITAYRQLTLSALMQLLPNLDASLDVDATGGYIYEIAREVTTCKK